MSDGSRILLSDARTALERTLLIRPQLDLAIVFSSWVLDGVAASTEAKEIVERAASKSGAQQDFQAVAILGFAAHDGVIEPGTPVLKTGLDRLSGRTAFIDETPMPFCSDAVGILGVALGARGLGDERTSAKIVSWLSGFLKRIYVMAGTEDWQKCLFHAASHVLDHPLDLPGSGSACAADMRAALWAKGVFHQKDVDAQGIDEAKVLETVQRDSAVAALPYVRSAIRLSALNWVTRSAPVIAPNNISVPNLVELLRRTPAGLRKWTWETQSPVGRGNAARKWHIDNEYHVQNVLWMLLSPIFPDIDDEKYMVKVGKKQPRADLYIPSLKLVVEAKFFRKGDAVQKVIDEIAADSSLYLAKGSDCTTIIPYVWDDGARTHEHDYLRNGLQKLRGIAGAVIVARPSTWFRDDK